MIGALRKLFIPKPPLAVTDTYIALVAAARNPFFFTSLGVPDSLDGRFELIVLHLFMLEHRLVQGSKEDKDFAQFLSEEFFRDMDRNLREMGVADTGVSHRIKKMGKAYHGRLQAYAAGLGNKTNLCAALSRNVYGTLADGNVDKLHQLADYVEKQCANLAATDTKVITTGTYSWADPA